MFNLQKEKKIIKFQRNSNFINSIYLNFMFNLIKSNS